MKKILPLLAMLVTFCSEAQIITVIDNNTFQPIDQVEVRIQETLSVLTVSNEKGELDLTPLDKKLHLLFYHPMYRTKRIDWDELKSNNYIVKLIDNTNTLDEIVVSSSKFNEKRKDVSQKIQVLRANELQNMNQTSTADILANTGNVFVQKSQLGGGSPLIRGFEANKVLLVVDGIRMNNAIYRGGHLQNVITLDNAIMDRVEVVFGPGSVVYGSDALGGVMSFTTKNPLLSTSGKPLVKANAFTRYMSVVNGYAAHADISVGGKRFGSLTSFTYANYGDLRQGANREPSVGNFGSRPWYVERVGNKDSIFVNKDTNLQVGSGYSQYDIMQKFLFRQNQKVKHILNLQFSNSSNVDRYDRLTQLSNGKPKFAEWYYGPQKRLLASYTLQLSGNTKMYDNARFILGYQQIEESRMDRKLNNTGLNNRIENLNIFTLNVDLAKKLGRHELRYGLEGLYNTVQSTAFTKDIITGEKTALDTRYASGGAAMNTLAIYLTHTWEISKKLVFNDGLRFSNVGLRAKFIDTTFFNFPFKDANQSNNALTGNVGLVYMPDDECRITALVSSGFRAPNVDDLSKVFESTPGTINVPNNELKPEYTYNGELGISNTFGSWLTAQATGYYTFYQNALTTQNYTYNGQDSIFYAGTMSRVVATTNANRAYLYGMELALNGKLNDHVSYYATYNFTYGRIVTDSSAIPLDHIPPSFGKFGVQVVENKLRGEFFVNFSAWKRIQDYNPFGEDNQAYALPEGMPSWYTLNLRVGYQFNRYLNLQVACENILDRNYRQFASNISAPGRNFIVTLRGSL